MGGLRKQGLAKKPQKPLEKTVSIDASLVEYQIYNVSQEKIVKYSAQKLVVIGKRRKETPGKEVRGLSPDRFRGKDCYQSEKRVATIRWSISKRENFTQKQNARKIQIIFSDDGIYATP